MLKKGLLFFVLIISFYVSSSLANELDGSIAPDGDGKYTIDAQDDNGVNYSGEAEQNGDDLTVNLTDDDGNECNGTASPDGEDYDIDVTNQATGENISGTLTLDN